MADPSQEGNPSPDPSLAGTALGLPGLLEREQIDVYCGTPAVCAAFLRQPEMNNMV